MCGIAGITTISGSPADCIDFVDGIIRGQQSRGPDAFSVKLLSERPLTVFGHNRLSIIDLTSFANQPFVSADGRFTIAFNGEIYNYIELKKELQSKGVQFRTTSDTEVLLEAYREWGVDVFRHLVGMFAFSLWDRNESSVILARDRFGKKPLFLVRGEQTIAWASSSRNLARRFNLQPSLAALARGIQYRVFDDVPCLYEGMEVIQPGHYLKLDSHRSSFNNAEQCSYYSLTAAVTKVAAEIATESQSTLRERVCACLDEAVAQRLRSDVPLGIALSGGLDSTTVAALAIEHGAKPLGFSFAHPDATRSEGGVVNAFSKCVGMEVQYVWPYSSADELFSLLESVVDAQDGPFPTTSMMAQYLVYRAANSRGIKVILGGQGGDEAFMGYRKFQLLRIREALSRGKPLAAIADLGWLTLAALYEGHNLKAYLNAIPRYLGRGFSKRLMLPSCSVSLLGGGDCSPERRQIQDFEQSSLPSLLRYEDRNSMGNSVESRLPFMDHRLVELGIALPTTMKISRGYGKYVLRQVMASRLPPAVTWARYKRGFDETQGWLRSGLAKRIRTYLKDNRDYLRDILPASTVIDVDYADDVFVRDPQAFGEATAMIWMIRYRSGQ